MHAGTHPYTSHHATVPRLVPSCCLLQQETAEDIAETLSVVDLFLDPCAHPARSLLFLTDTHLCMQRCLVPQSDPSSVHEPAFLYLCALGTDVCKRHAQWLTAAVLLPAAQRYQALQPKRQRLVAMVCYYGKHYMAFVLVRFVTCCCHGCWSSCSADQRRLVLSCCSRCVWSAWMSGHMPVSTAGMPCIKVHTHPHDLLTCHHNICDVR